MNQLSLWNNWLKFKSSKNKNKNKKLIILEEFREYIITLVLSTFVMWLPLLYPETQGNECA